MVARFHEMIPTVKSISSSEIYKNFRFLPKLPFCSFSEKLDFLGVSQFISPFVEIIEKRGWSLFSTHKPPGFFAVVREFYTNMAKMKEDSVYVRGV